MHEPILGLRQAGRGLAPARSAAAGSPRPPLAPPAASPPPRAATGVCAAAALPRLRSRCD
eukprot:scaffold29728_cov63-Phaeocystis_antarctica.AAC.3